MTYDAEATYCLRHPAIQTNLRCGRCGALICPRCMVQSPVGARCPLCARIGRSPMLDVSGSDLGRSIGAGLLTALVMGALYVGYLLLLSEIPFGNFISVIGIVLGQAGVGYVVGEAVRRAGRYKIDKKLRYIAGLSAFVAYITSLTILIVVLQLDPRSMVEIIGLIGMAVSVYVAMNRLRP